MKGERVGQILSRITENIDGTFNRRVLANFGFTRARNDLRVFDGRFRRPHNIQPRFPVRGAVTLNPIGDGETLVPVFRDTYS